MTINEEERLRRATTRSHPYAHREDGGEPSHGTRNVETREQGFSAMALEVDEDGITTGDLRHGRHEPRQENGLDGHPSAADAPKMATVSSRPRTSRTRSRSAITASPWRRHTATEHQGRRTPLPEAQILAALRHAPPLRQPSSPHLKRGGLRRQRDRVTATQLRVDAGEVLEQDRPRHHVAGQMVHDDEQAAGRSRPGSKNTTRKSGPSERRNVVCCSADSRSIAGPTSASGSAERSRRENGTSPSSPTMVCRHSAPSRRRRSRRAS